MEQSTKSTKISDIKRSWHLIDAKGQVLGRVATQIALKLMGKSKTNFVRNMDCGDYVVVINAAHFVTTGKKEVEKMYGNYSGHPGGLKSKALWQVREETPKEPMKRAVYGMLPKNKLRDRLITRLYIFSEEKHTFVEKFKEGNSSK